MQLEWVHGGLKEDFLIFEYPLLLSPPGKIVIAHALIDESLAFVKQPAIFRVFDDIDPYLLIAKASPREAPKKPPGL